ncbi:MAG: sigma-70 family RNA polymerase sigma factor [Candidatus Neomarinimicrobiota bacterium]
MKEEIRQLIKKAQAGDAEAFHELVKLHDERVMILAYQLTHNEQDAEDLYQEVFLKAYKSLKNFRFESQFYTWLYRITVNTAFNYKRKLARLNLYEPDEENSSGHLEWIADTDDNESSRGEIMSAVKDAMTVLPQKQKTVFILKHLENLKIKDISRILDISEGTVKRYLFRAMEKLRVELKEYRYA